MPRSTPAQMFETNARKLVKEIWENELNRDKSELAISWGPQFMTIEREQINSAVKIHRSSFDTYFNADNKDFKRQYREALKPGWNNCYETR